jgi:hypothetical protein
MKDVYLKVGPQDRLRMERIILDRDCEDALALVKQWLEIVAQAGRGGMRSHLDGGPQR